MRVLRCATVLAVAIAFSLAAVAPASAWCGWRCRNAMALRTPVAMVVKPRPLYPAHPYSPIYLDVCIAETGMCYRRWVCHGPDGRRLC